MDVNEQLIRQRLNNTRDPGLEDSAQAITDVQGALSKVGDANAAQAELAATGQPFDLRAYLSDPNSQIPQDALTRAQLVEALYEAVGQNAEALRVREARAGAAYDQADTQAYTGEDLGRDESHARGLEAQRQFLRSNPAPDASLASASQEFVDEHEASTLGRLFRDTLGGLPNKALDKVGMLPEQNRLLADQLQNKFSPTAANVSSVGSTLGNVALSALFGRYAGREIGRVKRKLSDRPAGSKTTSPSASRRTTKQSKKSRPTSRSEQRPAASSNTRKTRGSSQSSDSPSNASPNTATSSRPQQGRKKPRVITDAVKKRMKNMRQKGQTQQQIADKLGVSVKTVRKYAGGHAKNFPPK